MENYLPVVSLTKDEFDERKTDLSESDNATLTSEEDIRRIENILDLSPGLLKGKKFYVSKRERSCGRTISFYDLLFTALVEQWHSPSFIAHTLLGRKYIVNKPRPIRCSNCGDRAIDRVAMPPLPWPTEDFYDTGTYGCCL